jgi:hypothetical protein
MAITHTFASGKSDGADPTLVQPSNWNDDHVVDSGTITRAMLAADAIGWEFLGRAFQSGVASPLGPLVLNAAKKHMQIRIFIAGYASGGGVARVQFGGAAIDTGANYSVNIIETTTSTTGTALSGIPVASAAITGPRFVVVDVYNVSAQVKRAVIRTNSNSVSASTAPTQASVAGIWVNTSSLIQRVQLSAFTTSTGTTAVNMNGGTEFEVWGRDDE